MKKFNLSKTIMFLIPIVFGIISMSCNDRLTDDSFGADDVLDLSVSNHELILEEHYADNSLTFNWTTGSNQGTGSSISYLLEIDKEGNNFSSPVKYDLGKNAFSFAINYGTLNDILLNTFGEEPGIPQTFETRLTATVSNKDVVPQVATTNFTITPYKPVSTELYILGSATPDGEGIANAVKMTPSTSIATSFVYEGQLFPGDFKFSVSQGECLCQDFYTKDSVDDSKMVYNENGMGEDLQWEITEAGQYKVEVNLLDLSIKFEKSQSPTFSKLWIVGDASPSGWNIDSPEEFEQSTDNPFIFTYEAHLKPGEFKIFAGPLGDWCGQWYRSLVNDQDLNSKEVEQNSGCDVDNKWKITEDTQGRYKITLDTSKNTITFEKINLYLIGDGGPNGWNIANPSPMGYTNGKYVFTGDLGSDNPTGEFKISKFAGDWCDGQWINAAVPSQSILDTNFILTQGCDGPDNKWKLKDGNAGQYEITIDLDKNIMTITKQ